MRLAIIILVMFLTASSCSALDIEDVTFNYHAPGTLKIKYTGVYKVFIDEVREFLEDEWRSDTNTFFYDRQISLSQHSNSMLRLAETRKNYGLNGCWWLRPWFQNLPSDKGGVPRRKTFVVGREGDIIDLGIARIDENFRFQFKEYRATITRNWKFKFAPHLTGNTNDFISRASASFIFEYFVRKKRVFRFTVELGYKTRLNEFIEFRIEMFNL